MTTEAAPLKLPPFVRFEARNVPRSQIDPDPLNPRYMDASSKKRLREVIHGTGLLEALVWNEVVLPGNSKGHLIGGHQRLEQMDKLMKYPAECPDYLVPCNVVRLETREREREVNILLNNPNVQGSYDFGLLEGGFLHDGLDPRKAGFEMLDMSLMFGAETAAALERRLAPVAPGNPAGDEAPERERSDAPDPDPGPGPDPATTPTRSPGDGDTDALNDEARKVQAIQDRKLEYRAEHREGLDSDHILVSVFRNVTERLAFNRRYGLPPDKVWLSADALGDILAEQTHELLMERLAADLRHEAAAMPTYDQLQGIVADWLRWRGDPHDGLPASPDDALEPDPFDGHDARAAYGGHDGGGPA